METKQHIHRGDKVRLKGPRNITGKVIEVKVDPQYNAFFPGAEFVEYLVQYDDGNLCPTQDYHRYEDLISLEKIFNASIKCECGAKYTSEKDLHLRWCPLFREII